VLWSIIPVRDTIAVFFPTLKGVAKDLVPSISRHTVQLGEKEVEEQMMHVAAQDPAASSVHMHARDGTRLSNNSRQAMAPPPPLTSELLDQALLELGPGSAHAVKSCYDCYMRRSMSGADLISFIKSISSQSATLRKIFAERQYQNAVEPEIASLEDLQSLMQASGCAPSPAAACSQQETPSEVTKLASVAMPTVPEVKTDVMPTKAAPRVRRTKQTEPSDEETRLMIWWSDRRVPEVQRRQTETMVNACIKETGPAAFLKYRLRELSAALPASGKAALLEIVRSMNSGSMSEITCADSIKDLVNDYGVKVVLKHQSECNVRAVPTSWRTGKVSVKVVDDDDDVSACNNQSAEFQADGVVACTKRKRTQTLNGEGPKMCGEEEEDAVCPVCRECPREDDRWVKCDGCASWYHQICVLFNEQAHGKSVRFFCRTPGCRKRGSRQLNRRQRKPCYPTSTSLSASALGDYLTSVVAPIARSDRPVLVRLAAHQRREGRAGVVVHEKTILAFQHTMIGSDLLFIAMFVKETRLADGSGYSEVTRIDANGLYEEERHGESAAVEHAVVKGYLQYAVHQGFASVSFPSFASEHLFVGMNENDVTACVASVATTVQHVLRNAHQTGLVHAIKAGSFDGNGGCIAHVRAPGDYIRVSQEADATVDSVAISADDWHELQASNNYSFAELQFAKFSSMMLVYHLIKGWERSASRIPQRCGRAAAAARFQECAADVHPTTEMQDDYESDVAEEQHDCKRHCGETKQSDVWHDVASSHHAEDSTCAVPPPPPPALTLSREPSFGLERESRRLMSASLEPFEQQECRFQVEQAVAKYAPIHVTSEEPEGGPSNFFSEFHGMFLAAEDQPEDAFWDTFIAGV